MSLPENPNTKIHYDSSKLKTIYTAGGCFWGVEAYMQRVYGVAETTCGYANGNTANPTYEDICRKDTNHAETVKIKYAPEYISLENLLKEFFQIIDPTSLNRQGGDRGIQYRTGIYYLDANEISIIKSVFVCVQKKYTLPIVTELLPLKCFYEAEEYHQKYLEKNPNGYCHINFRNF